MEEAKGFVGLVKVTDPGIPRRIADTVAKPSESICKDKNRIWRMDGDDDVCNDMTETAGDTNSSLSYASVQGII